MASYNDITGDKIATRTVTKQYGDNFDNIFRKDKVAEVAPTPDKPVEPIQLELDFDEDRIDTIGTNGNDGLHYEEIK
jgi:hypothetical protein